MSFIRIAFIALLAFASAPLIVAQDDPAEDPPASSETLPPLPSPPYVQEHAELLKKHIEAAKTQKTAAQAALDAAKAAAEEEGLSDEEQALRDEDVEKSQAAVAEIITRIETYEAAFAEAEAGPTQEEYQIRLLYDQVYALAIQVRKDLQPQVDPVEAEEPIIEGDYAKRVRDAEEEQFRIEDLATKAEDFEFSKSRVYDKLSDLEKLDYERRWASQRFQLSVDAYNHLSTEVFTAYKAYELRALEGLKAIEQAKELWKQIEGTSAQNLELPGPANSPETLTTSTPANVSTKRQIETHYDNRMLVRRTGNMNIRQWENRLRNIQQEIDLREDYMERLESDAERLKNILAASEKSNGDASGGADGDASSSDADPEEYQKLGEQIEQLKQDLVDNKAEIEKLTAEREELIGSEAEKKQVENEVEGQIKHSETLIAAIEWKYLPEDKKPKDTEPPVMPADAKVTLPDSAQTPRILLFTLREELKAQKERLSSAKRDTRQAMTQVEILDRRVKRLTATNEEIKAVTLPETREIYYEEIGKTVGWRAGKVAIVIAAAWLLLFLIRKIGEPLIERIVKHADDKKGFSADEQQRARTLMTVFMTTARVVVYITAIMFAIAQFDVDYGPLLVAAGGVSLAVGFGAQTLVKDFFAGFFILLEGQFSIGDVIEINGKTGTVENLNLRTTVIRGLNGDVHTIPNGEISVTTNQTKVWSRAVVDVGVGYEENTDHVAQVMEGVAKEMREEEPWDKKVLDAIFMGVQELGDSSVNLRILLKTRAGEQWGAAREYRRRVKLKFDELGIEIPWPQTVLSYKAYDKKEASEVEKEERAKQAKLLRYVRKMKGEVTEEEAELAKMSVEERDRAETMAKREAELAKEKSDSTGEDSASEIAEERKDESEDDENISDAERLAKKLATKHMKKEELEGRGDDPRPMSDEDAADELRKQIPKDGDDDDADNDDR